MHWAATSYRNIWVMVGVWLVFAIHVLSGSIGAVAFFFLLIAILWYDVPGARPLTRRSRWIQTGAASLLVLLSILGLGRIDELPECDSSAVTASFRQMVEQSPASKLANIKLYALKDVKQCAWKEDGEKRVTERACLGTAYTNGGTEQTAWRMKWLDRKTGEWWIEASNCLFFDSAWKRSER